MRFQSRPPHFGYPLVSIAVGPDGENRQMRGVARGILAIGDVAIEGIAVGGLAIGLLTATGGKAVLLVR